MTVTLYKGLFEDRQVDLDRGNLQKEHKALMDLLKPLDISQYQNSGYQIFLTLNPYVSPISFYNLQKRDIYRVNLYDSKISSSKDSILNQVKRIIELCFQHVEGASETFLPSLVFLSPRETSLPDEDLSESEEDESIFEKDQVDPSVDPLTEEPSIIIEAADDEIEELEESDGEVEPDSAISVEDQLEIEKPFEELDETEEVEEDKSFFRKRLYRFRTRKCSKIFG